MFCTARCGTACALPICTACGHASMPPAKCPCMQADLPLRAAVPPPARTLYGMRYMQLWSRQTALAPWPDAGQFPCQALALRVPHLDCRICGVASHHIADVHDQVGREPACARTHAQMTASCYTDATVQAAADSRRKHSVATLTHNTPGAHRTHCL